MKKFTVLFTLFIVLFCLTFSYAAPIETWGKNSVTVSNLDASWECPYVLRVDSIHFIPSSDTDVCIIYDMNDYGGLQGSSWIFRAKVDDTGDYVKYFPSHDFNFGIRPKFVNGLSDIAVPANARIVIIFVR